MSIVIEKKELKKLVNNLVMGVLENLRVETKMADREGNKVKTSKSAFFTTSSIWQTGEYIM